MYLRTVKSNGVEYVQLAHNERVDGKSRVKVIHGFGRKDRLDTDALKRLIGSMTRFLEPEDTAGTRQDVGLEAPFEFLGAKEYGGTHLLDGLWQRLGIAGVLKRLTGEREFGVDVERLLFALVAQRALEPGSKLAAEAWVNDVAFVDDLPEVEVQQFYRAMGFLLEAHDDIQREVFWSVKNLFNLEVDLIFVDTTSTYFEIEGEDQDEVVDDDGDGDRGGDAAEPGLRKRGYSKDSRADLAQAVLGFAVTRDGIPVRCWVWPGNTVDVSVVEEVKRDLNDWKLGRVVMVMDTGFNSAENRRTLQGAGDHFIIGEKMRLGKDGKPPEALSRPGRYKTLANGLRIKEVIINKQSVTRRRFVIVHNPEQAERDEAKRREIIGEAERRIQVLGDLTGKSHTKAVCDLLAHKVFGRYLREQKNGKLVINQAKVAAEAKLDGKYLISTSDDGLSAEDVAMGYKQLYEIERVNRDLKHTVDVRPVYHRRADRIKAHVLLCRLALLLIRIAENESGESWHQLKKIFRPLLVGYHATQHGNLAQTNKVTTEQKRVLDAVNVKPPKLYLEIPTPNKA